MPIFLFLFRSIDNSEIYDNLPRTDNHAVSTGPASVSDETAFSAALIADMKQLADTPKNAVLARRLNYKIGGIS